MLFIGLEGIAQDDSLNHENFWSRIFLPSIDAGYQIPNTDLLEGSVRIGTSIEYRIKNNNDFFIRLNYDTYGARYTLGENNTTTNTIEGTVQFTDLVSGPGYRWGDQTFRVMFAAMPGIKLYEYPTAQSDGQAIIIESTNRTVFTTIFLSTLEYYLDEKSALTFSLYQNQVWRKVDFWQDGGSAVGFSIGFITSLL
jgi:hypothetical protein